MDRTGRTRRVVVAGDGRPICTSSGLAPSAPGLGTIETLRRALRRRVNVRPTDYRNRYAATNVVPLTRARP